MIPGQMLTTTAILALKRKKAKQKSLATTEKNKSWSLTYEEKLVEELEKMIKEHLSKSCSISSLAAHVAMSESSLYRFLKKKTGLTPGQFIRDIRLQEAIFLLESQQYKTVSEVVYAIGFKDASSFTRLFKKRFGKSPSTYLESISRRNTGREEPGGGEIVHAFEPKIRSTSPWSSRVLHCNKI
ncbi:MAG: AraC family transcriptional regulator [Cytophagales bacterium]|nr:AraC family transcriptional regulator [Cytophagales bacterium]